MDAYLLGWRPNLRGEGDNHLVELAVAGRAERIVTRDVRDPEGFGAEISRAGGRDARAVSQGSESKSALTFRLADDKHQRLNELARHGRARVNRLIEEMTTPMLAEFDAETRVLLRARRGRRKMPRGLELLAKVKHA